MKKRYYAIILISLVILFLLYLRFFVYTNNPIINFKCEFNTCSGVEGLSCERPSGIRGCALIRDQIDICRNLAYCSNSLTKCEFKKTSGFDKCVQCVNSCFIPNLNNSFMPGLAIECVNNCYLSVAIINVCNEITDSKLKNNCLKSIDDANFLNKTRPKPDFS